MPELFIYFKISEELARTACFLLTVKTSMALARAEPNGGTSPTPAARRQGPCLQPGAD